MRKSKILPVVEQSEEVKEPGQGTILNLTLDLDTLKPGEPIVIQQGDDQVRVQLFATSKPSSLAELYTMSVAYRKGPGKLDKTE